MSAHPVKHTQRRLVVEAAKKELEAWELPWHLYDVGRVVDIDLDGMTCAVEWYHKKTKAIIRVSEIWWDMDTKEIMQVGHNYGKITL